MNSLWLRKCMDNVTSQNGEDGVIEAIFDKIGTMNKFCCEFGADDGITYSNTWRLIRDGWNAVLIEPNEERFKLLDVFAAHQRGRVMALNCSVEVDGYNGQNSLDNILKYSHAPRNLDLLSIDVDGLDLAIWRSLKHFHPRVVIIEVNSFIPPGKIRDATWLGACIQSVVKMGKSKGYELALHLGNCIFVCREDAPALGIDPDNWQELFDWRWIKKQI